MYKLSEYNSFVPYKGKILYFNAVTKSNFTLTSKEHDRMKRLFADPISFSLEYPSVFNQFYKWGFIVDSEINELSFIRYKYHESLFSNIYHIVVTNTWENEISQEFIDILKLHLIHVIQNTSIECICLEWRGQNILSCFDKYILPVSQYVEKLSNQRGLRLLNQLEINASNNESLHNKLFHDKGKPTYYSLIEQVQKITSNLNFTINLRVQALPYSEEDARIFLQQFSKREKIYLVWKRYESNIGADLPIVANKKGKNKSGVAFTIGSQEATEINPEVWIKTYIPRSNFINIWPDRKVSMEPYQEDSNFHRKSNKQEGFLNEDGKIDWDNARRELILSQPWFENQMCTACKYLPLFIYRCINYKIDEKSIVCPIRNNLVIPESIMVSMYEAKLKNEI